MWGSGTWALICLHCLVLLSDQIQHSPVPYPVLLWFFGLNLTTHICLTNSLRAVMAILETSSGVSRYFNFALIFAQGCSFKFQLLCTRASRRILGYYHTCAWCRWLDHAQVESTCITIQFGLITLDMEYCFSVVWWNSAILDLISTQVWARVLIKVAYY